ncbi:MAG TPA: response regulator [Rhizomicrobium sp.]|nr:response regulator [Rhizomicrobium sp.]
MTQCLIVDASRVIRRVTARILEDLKIEALEAEDGSVALDGCRHTMPDAILLDAHTPSVSAIEFLRVLRREEGGTTPVVVFCTTENDADAITAAVTAGANDFLLKPYDRESLENKLAELGLLGVDRAEHARL